MFSFSFLRRMQQTQSSREARTRRSHHRRLAVEAMEARILLSHKAGHEPPGGGGGGGGGGGDDGTTIENPAFVYVMPGKKDLMHLHLATADGSTTVQLTDDKFAGDVSPSWAPDGSQIAFLRRPDPGKACVDVYTIRPDKTELSIVRDFCSAPGQPFPQDGPNTGGVGGETTLTWSPDGNKIVFVYLTGEDLVALDVATGTVETLINDNFWATFDPDWSPDLDPATAGHQGKIIFAGIEAVSGEPDVYLLDVAINGGVIDTGQVTKLIDAPGRQETPTWSPDGGSIVYRDGDDLVVATLAVSGTGLNVSVQVTATQTLFSDPGNWEPSWSSDSQYVAVHLIVSSNRNARPTYDLFRIRADGTEGPINFTNTGNKVEYHPEGNPNWVNDIDTTSTSSSSLTTASTGSSNANLLAATSELTAASLDTDTSSEASQDNAAPVSVAAPLLTTATSSTASTDSEPAASTTDDTDAVDAALSDFNPGPLDDALLEDLAVALVG